MKYLFWSFLLLPLAGISQTSTNKITLANDQGIQFVSDLNWQEVIEKAKTENKMIFVDCYTTWCAPCKAMEKNVYHLDKVGAFFNEHFISVKVQMDQTRNDDDFVKSWYRDAKEIEKRYSIDAFPTYLFLSSDGKPLHRASGAYPANQFLAIAADALNPETQSYTLAAKYDPSKMDTAEMKKVAVSIRRSAPELAGKIALAYFEKLNMQELSLKENIALMQQFYGNASIQQFVKSYIGKLSVQYLLKPENIDLVITFLDSSKSRGFTFLYENSDKVDKVKNEGREYKVWFSKNYIDNVIYGEEIQTAIDKSKEADNEPNWNNLMNAIQKKYNKDYGARLVVKGKMSWYSGKKDYESYCKYLIDYMEGWGSQLEFDWGYNNNAWALFQNSTDSAKLKKALLWSNHAVTISPNANWMDTYANLLYKLGRKTEAIRWEQVANKLDPMNKDIEDNLNKIKTGVPTWPQKN